MSFKPNKNIVYYLFPISLLFFFLVTYPHFRGFETAYFALTIFSIIAGQILLNRLDISLSLTMPVIVIFIIFAFAYYLKLYVLIINPDMLRQDFVSNKLYSLLQYPDVLFESYSTITYAFIVFCATTWLMLPRFSAEIVHQSKHILDTNHLCFVSFCLATALMIITFFIMYLTGISRAGADNPLLPFQIAGWTFNIRSVLIPALLLLLIWAADMAGMRKYLVLGILMLILHGFSDSILRASRSAILAQLIYLATFWIIIDRLTKKRALLLMIGFSIFIVLFPVFSSYRSIRATDYSSPLLSSLYDVAGHLYQQGTSSFNEIINEVGKSIFFRFTGADSLVQVIGGIARPLYADALGINVTRFFTVDIQGFPVEAIHGSAPSLLGWFYIVGGNAVVVISIFLLTLCVLIIWKWLPRRISHCTPVAQSVFIVWLIGLLTEGTLDRLLLKIAILIGSIIVCEVIARWCARCDTGL